MIEKTANEIDLEVGDSAIASRHCRPNLGFQALNAVASVNARFSKLGRSGAANMRKLCESLGKRHKLGRDHRFAKSD